MKITIGSGLLNPVGSRPTPSADESLTIEADDNKTKITFKTGQIEMTDGTVKLTVGGGKVSISSVEGRRHAQHLGCRRSDPMQPQGYAPSFSTATPPRDRRRAVLTSGMEAGLSFALGGPGVLVPCPLPTPSGPPGPRLVRRPSRQQRASPRNSQSAGSASCWITPRARRQTPTIRAAWSVAQAGQMLVSVDQ